MSQLDHNASSTPANGLDIEKHTAVVKEHSSLTDWDGPNDPGNPMCWPGWQKAYHTVASAVLGFAVTCGSSLITPSAFKIQEEFGVSLTAAILTLSLFALGLGLGPMIAAPISENYGRSVVYKTTAMVYLLFCVGAGFSTTFGSLLVCR